MSTPENRFENWLHEIARFPKLHAMFLNTLSFLEYTGARKILKSQPADTLSEEILTHIVEESRHALIFKKMALQLSGGALETYRCEHLLCGKEASQYFQEIDHQVEASLGAKLAWQNYLWTTLLIEERAAKIYPLYEKVLAGLGLQHRLAAVVRDEDRHLKDVFQHLGAEGEACLGQMRAIEASAFARFSDALIETPLH